MGKEREAPMSEAIEKAKQEVFALCRVGGHGWRMSIPVNDERDSDRIIIAGLEAAERAERTLADQLTLAERDALGQRVRTLERMPRLEALARNLLRRHPKEEHRPGCQCDYHELAQAVLDFVAARGRDA